MNEQNTTQRNDYVTHSEFEHFANKSERIHDKLSEEITEVRKEIVKLNVKTDALDRKIDRLLDKVNYSILDNMFPDNLFLLLPFIVMIILAATNRR